MKVTMEIEISKYLLITTLSANLINGRLYKKTYQQARMGEGKNLADIKALLLGCWHLNQKNDFELEIKTRSAYMTLCLKSLDKWQQDGWKNGKGKPIQYMEEWKEIHALLQKHKTTVISISE